MNKTLTISIAAIFMCATPLFAGGTPQEEETAAAAAFVDAEKPRAGFSRESENYAIWHTIEELLAKDAAEREAKKER